MKRLISLAVISTAALVQGCTTSTHFGVGPDEKPVATHALAGSANEVYPIALSRAGQSAVNGEEIGIGKDVPIVEGHPLTGVVVTQCNQVVAVYMTMPDGRLLRFDKKANVPAEQLVAMAYTATRSERVEVSCEGMGVTGYETHQPM